MLNTWMWNCDYGVVRLGDTDVRVDPVMALQKELSRSLGEHFAGRQIILERYSVFVNANAAVAASSWSTGMASVGLPVSGSGIAKVPKCEREKMSGGWFESAELTNTNSPIIAEVALKVDGKSYNSRAAISPDIEISAGAGLSRKRLDSPEAQSAIAEVVSRANLALVKEIQASMPQ